jgi:uncharacterized protein (DUF1778 family)
MNRKPPGRPQRGPYRDRRIEFRVSENEKELIETAAKLKGQQVSGFALPIILQAAQRVVEEKGHTILHISDWETLTSILEALTEPTMESQQMLERLHRGRRISGAQGDVYILDDSLIGDSESELSTSTFDSKDFKDALDSIPDVPPIKGDEL